MKGEKHKIIDILDVADIVFYDYKDENIPKQLTHKKSGKVEIFPWKGKEGEKSAVFFFMKKNLYSQNAEACFLDNKGLKLMLAGFPTQCHYFLLRIAFRKSWLPALFGLLRRVLKKQVRLRGMIKLDAGKKKQLWLVAENTRLKPANGARGYLSESVGVAGFIDFLRKEKIKYVVLRFYEKLPRLHREGGDLDILVADEDEIKVSDFLKKHPGKIGVDIWSVSSPNYRQMTYYPPHLAKSIIDNSVEGPAGSRIPNPKEAFLSLAYHAIYRKGPKSGIPSTIPKIKINHNPENDYVGTLSSMAKKIGLDISLTMESLDEYLHQEGWRPQLDTLRRFIPENEWVLRRFFSEKREEESGLGFFVFKQKAIKMNLAEKMIKMIENEHFVIAQKKEFTAREKMKASQYLRGGVWRNGQNFDEDFLPAAGVVVVDSVPWQLWDNDVNMRIRALKEKLRRNFDSEKESIVHATDNTYESWEYVKICFPDEIDKIRNTIKDIERSRGFSGLIKKWAVTMKIKIYYYRNVLKSKLRDLFMRLVMR